MIQQPIDMTFTDKKFSMILYGAPGVGKTTLALSAPNPILIDFDRGVSRVKAYHRKPTIVCSTYEEVLRDLESPEVRDCETIIIDTGGSFVGYLQDWAMRTNPKDNRQKNGALSRKGFGAVKQEFQNFSDLVRIKKKKHLIHIFHSDEQKDQDGNTVQRIICEGASRNTVWLPCDFGGYVQMIDSSRVISFTPTQEYFAKGCYGIEGQFSVPTVGPNNRNDFLTNLFAKAQANIAAENDVFAPQMEQYDATIAEASKIIGLIETAEDANAAVAAIKSLDHALTSKKETSEMLAAKAKELGLVLDKETKIYREAGQ